MRAELKRASRLRRHRRVRTKVAGTAQRPRLAVFRSNRHIYAQLIDDGASRTLAAASDVNVPGVPSGAKTERAKKVGAMLAERAKAAGVEAVVFDRGGNLYHGRVKALADGAREAGLRI
jgi:large subunit ribosomal protein L18